MKAFKTGDLIRPMREFILKGTAYSSKDIFEVVYHSGVCYQIKSTKTQDSSVVFYSKLDIDFCHIKNKRSGIFQNGHPNTSIFKN